MIKTDGEPLDVLELLNEDSADRASDVGNVRIAGIWELKE